MRTIIKGNNYNFYIMEDRSSFYIKASDRRFNRSSFINNLNVILSEFNISANDNLAPESQWELTRKQSILFFKKATKFLQNKNSRSFIEKKLDEDRECGEWENIGGNALGEFYIKNKYYNNKNKINKYLFKVIK